MKRILLIIALLLCGASAWGATFTTNASGEWQSATTWNTTPALGCHLTYPCGSDTTVPNGDLVVFTSGKAVYCDSGHVCSWGTSPQNDTTSAITTNSGFTSFTICGTAAIASCTGGSGAIVVFMQRSSFTNGQIIAYPGHKVFYDCTWDTVNCTADRYSWECTGNCTNNTIQGNADFCTPVTLCPVNWEGDASLDTSGLINSGTTCTADTCNAGVWGGSPGGLVASALGTVTNTHFHGFAGSTLAGAANAGFEFNMPGAGTLFFQGNEIADSGFIQTVTTSSTTGNLTIGGWFHNGSNTNGSQGLMLMNASASATSGTQIFKNLVTQGLVVPNGFTLINQSYKNWLIRGPDGGGIPNNSIGLKQGDSGVWDGIFYYWDLWNTGTTIASQSQARIPNQNFQNSIVWAEIAAPQFLHQQSWSNTSGSYVGGAMQQTHNYFGGFGFLSMNGSQVSGGGGGVPAAANSVLTMSQSVTGPGFQGWAAGPKNELLLAGSITNGLSYQDHNNVTWASMSTTLSGVTTFQNPYGAAAGESMTVNACPFVNLVNNLLTRTDTILAPGPLPKICDSLTNGTNFNGCWTTDYYGRFNEDATSAATNGICGQQAAWISGTAGAHDVVVAGRPAVLVNQWPVIPLFDVLYGFPSGFLNGGTPTTAAAHWTADPNWVGAWSNGATILKGQIYSDSQTPSSPMTITNCTITGAAPSTVGVITTSGTPPASLVGQAIYIGATTGSCTGIANAGYTVQVVSGSTFTISTVSVTATSGAGTGTVTVQPVYGGATTYWRAKVNHTASGLNRPITGKDASLAPWATAQFWEEAEIQPMEDLIIRGSTWSDGAIGAVNQDAVHVLNDWLIHSVQSMEPQMWTAGSSGSEMGIQVPINQHLPSVTVMSN